MAWGLQSADPCARGENLPLLKNSQSLWSCQMLAPQPLPGLRILPTACGPAPNSVAALTVHCDCPLGSDPLQANIQCSLKGTRGNSLGSPVVRIWTFHCQVPGSIPGWGTKIP